MKNLVIVESPNKIKKLEQYLGSDYTVMASVGHIRDLAKKGEYRLGIDWEKIIPFYIIMKDKREIVEELKKTAQESDTVWLATDPDREGEAIAWHLKEVLEVEDSKIKRITFNAITKHEINKAILKPRDIDYDLVRAQETRRVIDRVVGFRLSKLVQMKVKARSAGRVQSAVLKLILDRENEIRKFVPEKWWTLEAEYKKNYNLIHVDDSDIIRKVESSKELNVILNNLTEIFKIVDLKESTRSVKRPSPLEMSSYLSGMYSNFGFSNTASSITAQKLYEKGYISYPRTDSTRISSKEFLNSVEAKIKKDYGNDSFLSLDNEVSKKKVKHTEQDAHEAIRPTDINAHPNDLKSNITAQEFKAYKFIWRITIQSMMINGINESRKYILLNNKYRFIFSTNKTMIPGYRILNDKNKESIAQEKIYFDLLKLYKAKKFDIKIKKDKIEVIENTTKPSPRYTQASIIKKMKDLGIGRPSTYSPITKLLFDRRYILPEKSSIIPSELGELMINKLGEKFSDILNAEYTQEVENKFELIAHNELNHKEFLKKYYDKFEKRVEDAMETMEIKILPPKLTGEKCPMCGNDMELKYSPITRREFEGCTNYPECKYIKGSELKKVPIELEEKCPFCEKNLLIRFHLERGPFKTCSNFPRCRKYGAKSIEGKEIEILENLGEKEEIEKYHNNIKKREEKLKAKKKK